MDSAASTTSTASRSDSVLIDHDYSVRFVSPEDLAAIQERLEDEESSCDSSDDESGNNSKKFFSKCDNCRRSRTKVMVPRSVLSVAKGRRDGVTCDFCGGVAASVQPRKLPNAFEGRRGSKGGGGSGDQKSSSKRRKDYVYCGVCGKVVLKESLVKHVRDVHELSNKKQCHLCDKVLSGPFSLKEHVTVIHYGQSEKFPCRHCHQYFAHLSNLNRHVRLVHNKTVVTHKYVDCSACGKVVQATSLKKHMAAVHEQKRDFKCQYCSKSFAQSYTLKEHTSAKHTFQFGNKCRLCGKSFAHKTNCQRHLKTVHHEVRGKYASDQEMIKACMLVDDVSVGEVAQETEDSKSTEALLLPSLQ